MPRCPNYPNGCECEKCREEDKGVAGGLSMAMAGDRARDRKQQEKKDRIAALEAEVAELRAQIDDFNSHQPSDGETTGQMYERLVAGWTDEEIIEHILYWRGKSDKERGVDWGIARRDRLVKHQKGMVEAARTKLFNVRKAAKQFMQGQRFDLLTKAVERADRAEKREENTREWYGVRIRRLTELLKEYPAIWEAAACILANGTANPQERYNNALARCKAMAECILDVVKKATPEDFEKTLAGVKRGAERILEIP